MEGDTSRALGFNLPSLAAFLLSQFLNSSMFRMEVIEQLLGIGNVGLRFPGVVFRSIALPFDEILVSASHNPEIFDGFSDVFL